MTNYHLKPSDNSPPDQTWREAKEKRKKLLAQVRAGRRKVYNRLAKKMQPKD